MESIDITELPKDAAQYLKRNKKSRFRVLLNPAWLFLLLFIAAIGYFYYLVPDRYVSETKFIVKKGDNANYSMGHFSLLPNIVDDAQQDALLLKEYLFSEAVFAELNQKFNLRKHYASHNIDTMLALPADAPTASYLKYYQQLVKVSYDEKSKLITIEAQDFDPERAQAITQELLSQSESFINHLSDDMARNQLAFSKRELDNAKVKLEAAQIKLKNFQNRNQILSPESRAAAVTGMADELERQLIEEEINLKRLSAYLSEDSPKVQASKDTIAVLKDKIVQLKAELTGAGANKTLNTIGNEFEKIKFEEEFWRQNYLSALKAVEGSRIEAIRQLKYVLQVKPPSLPETSESPNRLYIMATAAVALLLLMGISKLVITTVKDHRDF